jgi:hypothetical protein
LALAIRRWSVIVYRLLNSLSIPSVMVQFAITPIDYSRLLGTALCYNADWVNRVACIAVVVADDYIGTRTGTGIEAIGMIDRVPSSLASIFKSSMRNRLHQIT